MLERTIWLRSRKYAKEITQPGPIKKFIAHLKTLRNLLIFINKNKYHKLSDQEMTNQRNKMYYLALGRQFNLQQLIRSLKKLLVIEES